MHHAGSGGYRTQDARGVTGVCWTTLLVRRRSFGEICFLDLRFYIVNRVQLTAVCYPLFSLVSTFLRRLDSRLYFVTSYKSTNIFYRVSCFDTTISRFRVRTGQLFYATLTRQGGREGHCTYASYFLRVNTVSRPILVTGVSILTLQSVSTSNN